MAARKQRAILSVPGHSAPFQPRRTARFRPSVEILEDRTVPANLVLINELGINQPGTDNPWEFIELKGVPNAALTDIYIISFEGDGAGAGTADFVINLTPFTLGSNGLLMIKSPTGGHTPPAGTTVVTDSQLDNSGGGLENGTVSFALIRSTTAIVEGTDYDTDNDGILEGLPGGAVILDAVGWTDNGTGDLVYGAFLPFVSGWTTGAATRFLHDNRATTVAAWYYGVLEGASDTTAYSSTLRSANFPAGGALTPGGVNLPGTNAVPVGIADNYDATSGETLNINAALGVLANDTDPDDSQAPGGEVLLSARLVSGPTHASSFTLNLDGSFIYTHNGNAAATDSFTYQATDLNLLSAVVTVTISFEQGNQAPVLDAIGNRSVDEGNLLTFTATAVDPDAGQTLTFSLEGTPPTGASIDANTGIFTWTPTEAQGPNTFSVTIRVTDNGTPNLFDEETIQITVNEINVAPSLNAIGNRSVDEGSLLTFTASASDPDLPANTLTYSLIGAPTGATIGGSTGVFTWTPTEAQGPGVFTFTVRVTDNGPGMLFDEEIIQVTVNEINAAPVLNAIGNQTVNEGSLLTFTAIATDADLPANALTFSLIGAPAGASIDPTTGVFTWTPTETQGPSVVHLTVRVTDNGTDNLFDEETIQITVNEVNQAPVLDPIGNRVVDEGNLLTFTATAADPDLPAQTLTYSLVGAPTGASINPNTGGFTWTPTEAQGPGNFTFTVRVTDNGPGNLFDEELIQVTVNEINVAPVLGAIGNRTVDETTLLTFTATATDADLPANMLTFSLIGAPTGASIGSTSGVFTWTPTEAQGPGAFTVTVRVTDNGTGNLFDEETIQITVDEVNTAPVLNPIGNRIVDEGTLLIFTAFAIDSDTPANPLMYSLIGAPTGAMIDANTGIFTWTPTEAQGPAVLSVTVRVTDNGSPSLFGEETIQITVHEVNQAPTLAPIGNKSVDEGSLLTFTALGTDTDLPAQNLTYSLIGAPTGAAINPTSGVFTWIPTEIQGPGDYVVTVRVTDNGPGSLFAEEVITITVNDVNNAPVLSPIGNRSVNEGTLLTFTAAVTDSDIPAQQLTFSLIGAPAGAIIDAATGVFTWTPTEAQGQGNYTVTIRVTDDGSPSLFDEETIQITVNEENTAPVLGQIGNRTLNELTLLTFTATATDSDLPTQSLTFSLIGAPTSASINPNTGVFTWTPNESQGPGIFTFTVRVTDNGTGNLTDEETIQVTVLEVNQAPILQPIGNRTIDEGQMLMFTAVAIDNDVPVQSLVFSLVDGPAGASIDPTTGAFSWSTNETTGPGTFHAMIRVTDNGPGNLFAEETIQITVDEVNQAPVLNPIGNRSIAKGKQLTFTATASDADLPLQNLVFSLDAGAPEGASIDPVSGVFHWAPLQNQPPGVVNVTIRVADSGNPTLSDSETILIEVVSFPVIVSGANAGQAPVAKLFDLQTGTELISVMAFVPGFRGGVRVAAGDVNGDGVSDLIAAAGAGGYARIRIFDGVNGERLPGTQGQILAFSPGFRGGVFVAAADLNGDGLDDIVAGSGGGLGLVRVFDGATGEQLGGTLGQFAPYGTGFRGGVRVAVGDVNGDGWADIVTGPGGGLQNHVRVFSGQNGVQIDELPLFFANPDAGFFLAAADINGDQRAEIIVSYGAGKPPMVRIFDRTLPTTLPVQEIRVAPEPYRLAVRIGITDINLDGQADLLVGTRGTDGSAQLQAINLATLTPLDEFFAGYSPALRGNLFVGGAL